MLLIINEKPSQARNFAKALGGAAGTFDGVEYRICALRGHVMGLLPPEDQVPPDLRETYRKWGLSALPFDLSLFAWAKVPDKEARDVLSNLAEELSDADEVAIATDIDPSGEGEMIAWEALEHCGWTGPVCRFKFPDEAPASVRRAFSEREPIASRESDGDLAKAEARERWDLASMQFTRAATCIARKAGFNQVVRQGRLKSAMVALVGDQLAAWKNYVRKPYFEARFKDDAGVVYARRGEDPESIRFDAPEKVDLSALHASPVVEDGRKRTHTAPGRLLDLSALSAMLAKKGFKPEEVLRVYQTMYENQVVSYPRTEDKKITPEQFDELLPHADAIAAAVGVDAALLTHRAPRKTHVKEGGAHGANRPGVNVPASLDEVERKYGAAGRAIYEALARNYLAMLAEDAEFEIIDGHVADFPAYAGRARVLLAPGFKAIFDADAASSEDEDGEEEKEVTGLGRTAEPYVHEGANKRPPKPTMKWLMAQLEKADVGTGATRTSTLAEISKGADARALLKESRGALALARCGEVSYALLDGCLIAQVATTKRLLDDMSAAGRFEVGVDEVVATVTPMVVHDIEAMRKNAGKLAALNLGGATATAVGKCPLCGKTVVDRGERARTYTCESNKVKKTEGGKWVRTEGCGFDLWKTVAGKKLTAAQAKNLMEKGQTGIIKGFTSKAGKKFDAKLKLEDPKTGKVGFVFQDKRR